MRYAIYGAGSLGIVLGAYIAKSGTAIDLINRNQEQVDALNQNGAKVVGEAEFTQPVRALLPEQMEGKYDVILLMTKQLANKEVVSFLKPFLAEDGVLCTMQNGLPEPEISKIIGADHTAGCVVEWGATLKEPGVSELTSAVDALSFRTGNLKGLPKERLTKVTDLLEKMCPVVVHEDLMGVRWSKLLINATFSGLATVVGGTFGDISQDPLGAKVAGVCMNECINVAAAAGITIEPVQGKDIAKLFRYKTILKKLLARKIIPIALKKHNALVPSMLQDIQNGKKCEIDYINGIVCRWGKLYSVATPVNDRIVSIIKKAQDGELTLTKANLSLFTKEDLKH